jgi:hypothetical protein
MLAHASEEQGEVEYTYLWARERAAFNRGLLCRVGAGVVGGALTLAIYGVGG